MAKEYRLSIIVSGRDQGAKSMLGGVGSALGSMGKIAGGILAAGILKKVADGVASMANKAYEAVGAYQKMEQGLISLQAREIKNAGELNHLNGYATANLHLTEAQAGQLVTLRTAYDNLLPQLGRAQSMYGVQSSQYQNINTQLSTYQTKILALAGSHGTLSTEQQKVVMNQLGMNDALKLAEPLAKKTLDQLQRIAVVSPYQMAQVQSTYQMAMAFGFTSKEATSFTKSMLNVAAGVGASGEQLDRMSYNLAQIRMAGKVTAMDIRQLAMAGFDLTSVLKYVGKQMGVNIQTHEDFNRALASGQIKWEDFSKYFAQYADENFGGAAERMSRTLEGLKSSFSDVFGILLPKIFGKPAERVTQWLGEFLDKIMTLAENGALEKLGTKIDDFLARFEGFKNISMNWLDQLLGIDAGAEYVRTAETPEDQRTARKELELEPPQPKMQIDVPGIIAKAGWTWVAITQAFDDQMNLVNWEEVSADMITGIGSIDWNTAGNNLILGVMNIIQGLWTAVQGIDWKGLYWAIVDAVGDFIFGMFGTTMEQCAQKIAETLTRAKTTALQKIDEMKNSAIGRFLSFVGTVGMVLGLLPTLAMTGLMALGAKITSWRVDVEQRLRVIAKVFHDRAVGWINQAIQGLLEMVPKLLATLDTVVQQIKGILENLGITIPVGISIQGGGGGGGGSHNTTPASPGGNCFAGNTPVLMGNGFTKPIAAVQVGDQVKAYDFTTGCMITATVVETFEHGPEEVVKYLEINGTLRVTAEHLIFDVERGWLAAGQLVVGSVLLNSKNEPVPVRSIDTLLPDEPVYNLHIDADCHNYFADDVLVHNAKSAGYASGGIATGSTRGHWELLHGPEAIIPLQGGAVPVSLTPGAGGGGATVVNVTVNYSPFVTTSDRTEARNKLAPFIADEVRKLLPQRL